MPLTAHHLAAVHHHRIHRTAVARENPAIGDVVGGGADQLRRMAVQHHGVGGQSSGCESRGMRRAAVDTAQQGFADAGRCGGRGDVAAARRQPLAVFEPTQFFHRRHRAVRIRAHTPSPVGIEIIAQRKQTVAEIRLGGRADRDRGAAVRNADDLVGVQMRGVHQRPARIDPGMIQQPAHRAFAADREAVLHFADLLGDMYVNARVARQRCEHGLHRIVRNRAQTVQGAADAQRPALFAMQRVEKTQIAVDIVTEATLTFVERATVEAAGHVQHRQQREPDAGIARSGDQRPRHRSGVAVGAAIGCVMQIMEFAHRGVTGFQHFRIQLRCDRM